MVVYVSAFAVVMEFAVKKQPVQGGKTHRVGFWSFSLANLGDHRRDWQSSVKLYEFPLLHLYTEYTPVKRLFVNRQR